MRLAKVDHGHKLVDKLKLKIMSLVTRREPPGVVKTLFYRKEFFGKPLNEVFQAAMRGPSSWSVGQRELFAAFVSRRNECEF